jgi:hypothetical protein
LSISSLIYSHFPHSNRVFPFTSHVCQSSQETLFQVSLWWPDTDRIALDNSSTTFARAVAITQTLSLHMHAYSPTPQASGLRCLLLMVAAHHHRRHTNHFAFITSTADCKRDGRDSAGTIMSATADIFRFASSGFNLIAHHSSPCASHCTIHTHVQTHWHLCFVAVILPCC